MPADKLMLLACGDINIQHRTAPEAVFEHVRDRLRAADVLIGNLEMCLAGDDITLDVKRPVPGRPAWTQSDPGMVTALTDVGFDAVTTANNVTYGEEAISRSLQTLDAHGIGHTGSGSTIGQARRPTLIDAPNGLTIGMVGYTCLVYPMNHEATETEPGVATLPCETAYEPHRRAAELPGAAPTVRSWPRPEYLEAVKADVRGLREQCDLVITYFHMGTSGVDEMTEYQRIIGRAMADEGVDIVLASSAHKPQAVEVHEGTPIFYGLGNFAFDWWFLRERYYYGLLAEFDIDRQGVRGSYFWPVTRTRDPGNQVRIPAPGEAEWHEIVERVQELSGVDSFDTTPDGRVTLWERPQ